MKLVVINFGFRKNDYMYYVGFSRVIYIENLYIIYLNEKKISLFLVVLEEMNRFRIEEKLNVCIDNLVVYGFCIIVLILFNLRLFYKYKEDLEKDLNFMLLDVLVIFEIRFVEIDEEEILLLLGYIMYRFDFLKYGI